MGARTTTTVVRHPEHTTRDYHLRRRDMRQKIRDASTATDSAASTHQSDFTNCPLKQARCTPQVAPSLPQIQHTATVAATRETSCTFVVKMNDAKWNRQGRGVPGTITSRLLGSPSLARAPRDGLGPRCTNPWNIYALCTNFLLPTLIRLDQHAVHQHDLQLAS